MLTVQPGSFGDENYKKHCWENLLDLFESNESSSILWDRYHTFQIMLAEQERTTDQYAQLVKRIAGLEKN